MCAGVLGLSSVREEERRLERKSVSKERSARTTSITSSRLKARRSRLNSHTVSTALTTYSRPPQELLFFTTSTMPDYKMRFGTQTNDEKAREQNKHFVTMCGAAAITRSHGGSKAFTPKDSNSLPPARSSSASPSAATTRSRGTGRYGRSQRTITPEMREARARLLSGARRLE